MLDVITYKQLMHGEVQTCYDCEIAKLRINRIHTGKGKVPGGGNINANVFLIGLAPSFFREKDIKFGVPFNLFADELYDEFDPSKEAGKRTRVALEKILKLSGIEKHECYVSNALKCSTPEDRSPTEEELGNCFRKFLIQEIKVVKPALMIGFGAVIRDFLQIPTFNLSMRRKSTHFIATYHPSYYGYRNDPEKLEQSIESLGNLVSKLRETERWKMYKE